MTQPAEVSLTDESKRQAVILIWTLVGLGVAISVERFMSSPDTGQYMKMWMALQTKRIAQSAADVCQSVALKAATIYNQEKA